MIEPGPNDTGENCDDGNVSGDGSSTCRIETKCGNGTLDPGEDCDDGASNGSAGDGCSATCTSQLLPHTITANWSLETLALVAQPCPTGFDQGVVVAQIVDPVTHKPITGKPPVSSMFSCTAKTGVTTPIPGGVYSVTLEVKNAMNTYATSLPQIIDLRSSNQVFSTVIYTDGGFFKIVWTLVDDANQPISCADAGAGSHGLVSTTITPDGMTTIEAPCGEGFAIDDAAPGPYTLAPVATTNNPGTIIGTGDPNTMATINAPNGVTEVDVTIAIDFGTGM